MILKRLSNGAACAAVAGLTFAKMGGSVVAGVSAIGGSVFGPVGTFGGAVVGTGAGAAVGGMLGSVGGFIVGVLEPVKKK